MTGFRSLGCRIAYIVLALLLPVAAAVPVQAKDAMPEKVLRIGVIGTLAGTHPDLRTGGNAYAIGGLALRGLTYFDGAVRMACLFCETLPSVANGGVVDAPAPDGAPGQKVRFRLRKGLAWDDGAPLVAADFVRAWKAGSAPDSTYSWRSRLSDEVIAVTAPDTRTIEVHRRGRSCTPSDFRFAALPAREEAAVASGGAGYAARSLYLTAPTTPGLYSGPYRVSGYDVSGAGRVTLTRNPAWRGPKPVYDRIELVYRPSNAAMVEALAAGEVDMSTDTSLAVADEVARRAPGRFADIRRAGRVLMQVTINQDDPRLTDPRVRRALLLALDRPALAASFGTGAQAATSFLTPRFPYFDAGIADPGARIDEARRLLDQAGWRAGADGMRRDAQGRALDFRLAVAAAHAERPFVATIIAAWRAIGVTATPERFGGIGQLTAKDPPPLALFGYQLEGGIQADFHVFGSRSIPKLDEVRNGLNIFRWRDAEADRAVEALREGCANDVVGHAYRTLQRRVAEDVPMIPLFFQPEAHLLPRDFLLPDAGRIAFVLPDEIEYWRVRD